MSDSWTRRSAPRKVHTVLGFTPPPPPTSHPGDREQGMARGMPGLTLFNLMLKNVQIFSCCSGFGRKFRLFISVWIHPISSDVFPCWLFRGRGSQLLYGCLVLSLLASKITTAGDEAQVNTGDSSGQHRSAAGQQISSTERPRCLAKVRWIKRAVTSALIACDEIAK